MRYVLCVFIVCLFFFSGCQNGKQQDNQTETEGDKTKLVIVHSYHVEYPWTKSIDDGIRDQLSEKEFDVKRIFMDTKRNTSEEFKQTAGQKALTTIAEFQPQIVILTDDNAQEYVGKHLLDKNELALVFCGMNAEPEKYGYNESNSVTGVLERPNIRKTLTLLNQMVPEIETYSLLTDDSPTSQGFVDYFNNLHLSITVDKQILTNDFAQWQTTVTDLSSDALITYMYHTLKADTEESIAPEEVMEWTKNAIQKPSIGFFDFAIESGVLIGNVESGFEHGRLAMQMAKEITKGEQPSELPIITASEGLVLLNKDMASKLNINTTTIEPIVDKSFSSTQ
jgi:ABC-type uncharacterized transport system substrate-binding protein